MSFLSKQLETILHIFSDLIRWFWELTNIHPNLVVTQGKSL
jgi:hypothetical protein